MKSNIFNLRDFILLDAYGKEFYYFKSSGDYLVRSISTGKPALFSLEELAYFISVVNKELSKGEY